MKTLKYTLFLFFTLVQSFLFPSEGTLEGTVLYLNNAYPKAEVSLLLGDDVISTTTSNAVGVFSLTIPTNDQYTLIIKAAGFEVYTTTVQFTSPQVKKEDYSLTPSSNSISGKVIASATGDGISGATVAFYILGYISPSLTLTTDSSGEFSTNELAPEAYVVLTNASGFSQNSTGFQATSGKNVNNFEITLSSTATGTLSGTVQSAATSDPDISNPVIIASQDGIVKYTTTGDAAGEYEIQNIEVGTYSVTANASSFETANGSATITQGATTDLDFTLSTSFGSVGGVVRDENNTPLSQAKVQISSGENSIGVALTDASGTYTISGLDAGDYTITTSKLNYQSVVKSFSITEGDFTNVDITLNGGFDKRFSGVQGTITSANTGSALPGATLKVYLSDNFIMSGLTDNNGFYSLINLPAYTYTITVSDTDLETQSINVTTTEGNIITQNFALVNNSSSGGVEGTVSDSGGALENVTVKIILDSNVVAVTTTDSEGDYAIVNIKPGDYAVVASKDDYQTTIESPVTIPSGSTTTQNFTLVEGGSDVSGTVLNAADNTGIAGALVTVNREDSPLYLTAFSSDDGSYSIKGLPTGTFTVTAEYPAFLPATSSSFTISSMEDVSEVENFNLFPITQNLVGSVLVNKFVLQNDRIHKLQWTASTDSNIVQYSISRNGTIVGYVQNTFSGTLTFEDHGRSPSLVDVYIISAIDNNGLIFPAPAIKLQ